MLLGALGCEEPVVPPPSIVLPEPPPAEPATATPARTDVPTVASFGGARCHAEEAREVVERTVVGLALAPTTGGRGILLWHPARSGGAQTQLFDARGATLRGPNAIGLGPIDDVGGGNSLVAALAPLGDGLVATTLLRDRRWTLSAVALDAEGQARGEAIALDIGHGSDAALTVVRDDRSLVVAYGTLAVPGRVERWTVDDAGTIERAALGALGSGVPLAVAVNGAHFAAVYRSSRRQYNVRIDDSPPVRVEEVSDPVSLRLDGQAAELRWVREGAPMRAVVAPPWPEAPVAPSPVEGALDRLPLDTALALSIRHAHRGRRFELTRVDAATQAPVARPLSIFPPRDDPYVAETVYAHGWIHDRAFVAWRDGHASVRLRAFTCAP